MPITERVASTVRRHAAQSGLITKLLRALSGRSTPPFLINRAAANGLVREEFEASLKAVKQWDHLPLVFSGIASELNERALYWDELGLNSRTSAYYLQSSLWDFYAQLLCVSDHESKALFYARCAQSYRHAAAYFEYPAASVEIPHRSGALRGYLRLPATDAQRKHPCVILINTVNSTKEELHYTENAFVKMGIATLSFDLPGFGESLVNRQDLCDMEILSNTLFLFIAQQREINPEKLALHGLGVGGALAINLALLSPQRYKAVATLSAPYNLKTTLSHLLPAVRREAVTLTHGAEEILYDLAHHLASADDLSDLRCPLLVAGGGRDILASAADTKRIYDLAGSPDKKLLYIPKAGHGCCEVMPSLRFEIAQWIRQRI